MANWEISSFAKDISDFIKLIETYDLPLETSELYILESKFQYQTTHTVEVSDLTFNLHKKIGGTIPSDIYKIAIGLDHYCVYDSTKNFLTHDVLTGDYRFLLGIRGYGDSDKEHRNYWRLDRDVKPEGNHKVIHPFYHFQLGGDQMLNVDTGAVIFLAPPRLPHPPMDLFLGIHFVLFNFFSTADYPSLKDLIEDHVYIEIIKRSQDRMWKYYFQAYGGIGGHMDYTFATIFPLNLR